MELEKEDLRRINISARISLDKKQWAAKSRLISKKLENIIDWSKTAKVHVYEPIASLGEVDITSFMAYLRQKHPLTELYTSRQFDDVWHVVHLEEGRKINAPKLDAIIVPMLGFDSESLNRIGYGGGYYDKFLASQSTCKKIGVCFEQGRIKKVPAEPHDVPMDIIVTEEKAYS